MKISPTRKQHASPPFFKGGFSLIELLIVLIFIAIIAAIGIPSFTTFLNHANEKNLNSQLMRAIYLSRSEAIARNEKMILCESVDQKTCSGQWQDGFIILNSEKILYAFPKTSAQGKLNWRAFPKDQQWLEFLSTGLPLAENGTFWFCPLNAINPAWAIVMNQSGRIRNVYPDAKGEIRDEHGQVIGC